MKFNKPAKTIEEQLDLLVERGLIVEDRISAMHYLRHLNYYRLAAYWLPFESSHVPHCFIQNTRFEQVLNYYLFDRELRLLLLNVIELIEVSLRTQWAYHLSYQYGSHGYLINTKAMQKNSQRFETNCGSLQEQINRSDEEFIKHYKKTYDEAFPPAWVSCEVMSLGLLSKFYSNLRAYGVRQKIATTYGMDEEFLEGAMEHICYIRNVCAHHSRLWNRHLSKKMPLPKRKPVGLRENMNIEAGHNIYNSLVLIQHFISVISPKHDWATTLFNLSQRYKIDLSKMGFPENWLHLPIWEPILAKK